MALTPANVRAGARRFVWDEAGINLELGITLEGSMLRVERGGEEQVSEQWGIAPFDFVYGGTKATFRGMFREWGSATVNTLLETFLPGSTSSAGPAIKAWQFGETAGVSARSIAKQLVLRLSKDFDLTPPANAVDDIVLHLAVPLMVAEVGLDNQGRSGVWAVSFLALVDTTKAEGNLLGRWKTQTA